MTQLKNMSLNELVNEYKHGFRLLTGSCGNIIQGTSKSLNVNMTTAGTLPYTFKIYRASGLNATTGFEQIETTYVGLATETNHSFPHLFNEAFGNYTFRGEITDSCLTPITVTNDCNVSIIAPETTTTSSNTGMILTVSALAVVTYLLLRKKN